MLCLHTRVPDLMLTGVELQPAYAVLAQRNGAEAGARMTVTTADLLTLPSDLRQRRFDHVIMNPPYFDRAHSTTATDPGKDIAFAGNTALADWLDVGIKRVAPKGLLTLIQRVERLPEVLAAVSGRLGSVIVQPITPRADRAANRVIVQAKQEGRAPFRLNAPHIMHVGPVHDGDRDSYTAATSAILRDAAELRISR